MFYIKEMGDVSMKKILCLIMALVICIGCCSCGTNNTKSDDNDMIDIKGMFFLNPENLDDWDKEELDSNVSYFMVVYDLKNETEKNLELDTWSDAITMKLNDANEYEQISSYSGCYFKDFMENAGYNISSDNVVLYGGSETIRMIAPFEINMNDISEKTKGVLNFDLCPELSTKVDFDINDIKTIDILDEIFQVEDDYKNYQIVRSAIKRARYCRTPLSTFSSSYASGNVENMKVLSVFMWGLFSNELTYGFSAGAFGDDYVLPYETLPVFDMNAIKTLHPDVANDFDGLKKEIDVIYNCFDKDNVSMSTLDGNLLKQCHMNILEYIHKIEDYFDIE